MNKTAPELIDALILIVDDDETTAHILRHSLGEFKNVRVFGNGQDALAFCRVHTPDLILLDVAIPAVDGLTVCREVREMSLLTRCPVIFMSSDDDMDTEVKSWEAGGSDFLRKPIVPAALKMRVMSHLTAHWHIEITNRLYHTDTLTGLHNRYYFDKHVKEQIGYAQRYRSDISLLLVDINGFRQFNEQYGHAAGDKCLKRIAATLRRTVSRQPDSVCRYAGDEFTVLLPGTDAYGADVVKHRIIMCIEDMSIPFEGELTGKLSVSIGQTSLRLAKEQGMTLFEAADRDLLLRKTTHPSKVA